MDVTNISSGDTQHFIHGDRFLGIAVSELIDKDYRFTVDDNAITVSQRVVRPAPDRICLGFLFLTDVPERFRMDVLIPEDCYNANCTLNGKELIGFFSEDLPENPEPVIKGNCLSGAHEKYSPMRAGEFQSVNFRWESGDVLTFCFYYRS